jgi:hypothetical protein
MFVHHFQKLKTDLENSKKPKFLCPTSFSHEEFNEHDKSKFGDDLMHFLI